MKNTLILFGKYGLALLIAVMAVLLRWAMTSYMGPFSIYLFLYPSMMAVTLYLGTGPGFLASLVGVIIADILITPPVGRLTIDLQFMLGAVMLSSTAIFVGNITRNIRRAKITAQAQANELRASEEHFRTIAESLPVFISISSRDEAEILYLNEAYHQAWGLKNGEMTGRPSFDLFFDPDDRGKITNLLKEQGSIRNHEVKVKKADGTPFWISTSIQPIYFGGKPALLSASIDITVRKLAEAALRQSKERLAFQANLLTNIMDVIYSTDVHLRITSWNQAAEKVYGWKEAEVLGKNIVEVTGSTFDPNMRRKLTGDLLGTGTIISMIEHTTRAGKNIFFESKTMLVRDALGKAIGFVAVNRDITEAKRDQEILQATLQRLHAIVSSMHGGILMVENDRVELANQTFCDYFGLRESPEELVGFTSDEVLEKIQNVFYSPDEELGCIREIVRQGRSVIGEEVAMQGGRTCLRDFIPIWVNEKSVGRLWYHADITERKRIEEALREADRRKDEFLALLAHELRNPLAPVRNAMYILHSIQTSDATLQRQRSIVERQITHMTRLLDDLLDVSRITRGKIILQIQPMAINEVLDRAKEIANPLITARRHTLHMTPAAGELIVKGDLERLTQITANLLMNAAKYTPEAGQIWLQAGREGDDAVIRVRDTGLGIASDMLESIFDMFNQGAQELGQGGLGIGLTLVRSLVRMHGGSVQAFSEGPGKGSEFVVRLSAEPGLPYRPNPDADCLQAKQTRPQRILVVDDAVDNARSLAEVLAGWGHEVKTAHNGPAALGIVRAFSPQTILLDIGLPGMNGFAVAGKIRKDSGFPVNIIAISGFGQEMDRRSAQAAGIDAYLVKPVDLEQLHELLEKNN